MRQDIENYHDGGEAILEAFRNLDVDYVISSPVPNGRRSWEAMARQKHSGTPAGVPGLRPRDHRGHHGFAYTQITGRMQAVLLHAGAGLLQGAMAVAARARWKRRCW